jgi:hypothetical protein
MRSKNCGRLNDAQLTKQPAGLRQRSGGSRAAALYSSSVQNKDIRQTNAVPFQCKQI